MKTQSEYEAMIITPEQGFKILMAMPEPERTLTLLIAATGLRISECLGLHWADESAVVHPIKKALTKFLENKRLA